MVSVHESLCLELLILNCVVVISLFHMSNLWFCLCSCTMGTVLPVYSTFKAIESKDRDDQQKWLLYWTGLILFLFDLFVDIGSILILDNFCYLAVYGSFSVAEAFTDKLISWYIL